MNFLAAAKTLDELMLELIGKGVSIPGHVVDDLKAGRSLAGVLARQPDNQHDPQAHSHELSPEMKTTAILQSAEMNLLSLAETAMGARYAEEWQTRVNAAYILEPNKSAISPASKFIPGVNKNEHWVRVQQDWLTPAGDADGLCKKYSITMKPQDDGYVLISGTKDKVSAFMAEIREITKKNGERK